MTNEQDKLGEAIRKALLSVTPHHTADGNMIRRIPLPHDQVKDDEARLLIDAAQKYHKIKPLLDEMIEARNDATKGEWKLIWEAGRGGIIAIKAADLFFARDKNGSDNAENIERVDNAKFIRTSANNTTKIQEIMKKKGKTDV